MDINIKDIFARIKCGLAGAMVLIAAAVGLFFFTGVGRIFGATFAYKHLAGNGFPWRLFISLGIIGFLAALIMRQRFPVFERRITMAGVLIAPLLFGVWFADSCAARVPIPHRQKLADFTNNSAFCINVRIPNGHAYQLHLVTPDLQTAPNGLVSSAYRFRGSISISNETSLIAVFRVNSDDVLLTSSGFLLTGMKIDGLNQPAQKEFIHAGENCRIEVVLNPPPPVSSGIWLYWLESRYDNGE